MKQHLRPVMALTLGVLLFALSATQGQAAPKNEAAQSLHRDGTEFVKETRITQAERQAVADRAKAKGFKAPAADGGVPPDKASAAKDGGPAIQSEQKGKGVKK